MPAVRFGFSALPLICSCELLTYASSAACRLTLHLSDKATLALVALPSLPTL